MAGADHTKRVADALQKFGVPEENTKARITVTLRRDQKMKIQRWKRAASELHDRKYTTGDIIGAILDDFFHRTTYEER